MASNTPLPKTTVPDGIFFELSPRIVCGVRMVNVVAILMVLLTFIFCLVEGDKNTAYYLLACNTIISAFVGLVVNVWYRGGDLGSEKFWYILVVAAVLIFQCITTDIYVFKAEPTESLPPVTIHPSNSTTRIYTWASFRTTHNKSLLQPPSTTPFPFH